MSAQTERVQEGHLTRKNQGRLGLKSTLPPCMASFPGVPSLEGTWPIFPSHLQFLFIYINGNLFKNIK